MPLSKMKNKDRMRKTRLHKRLLSSMESKPVQPKRYPTEEDAFDPVLHDLTDSIIDSICMDADGNSIPEI